MTEKEMLLPRLVIRIDNDCLNLVWGQIYQKAANTFRVNFFLKLPIGFVLILMSTAHLVTLKALKQV